MSRFTRHLVSRIFSPLPMHYKRPASATLAPHPQRIRPATRGTPSGRRTPVEDRHRIVLGTERAAALDPQRTSITARRAAASKASIRSFGSPPADSSLLFAGTPPCVPGHRLAPCQLPGAVHPGLPKSAIGPPAAERARALDNAFDDHPVKRPRGREANIADSGDPTSGNALAVLICAIGVIVFVEVPLVAMFVRPVLAIRSR